MLESIIPAEADVQNGEAPFKIRITSRDGELPVVGFLYFKLTYSYTGDEDISFNGTVSPTGENGVFAPRPTGMPYLAGMHGEGLESSAAIASIDTSDGSTLEVGIYGFNANASTIVNFIKSISVEYAWLEEA